MSSYGGRPSQFLSWPASPLIPAETQMPFIELSTPQFCLNVIYRYLMLKGAKNIDVSSPGHRMGGDSYHRFHAREYPAYDKYVFPYNMGYCQKGSHGVGAAIGHACLLLSAGSKGNWSMMPHSIAMIQQPHVPSSGLMPASDVLIRAKEAVTNRDTLIKLLAKHTENRRLFELR